MARSVESLAELNNSFKDSFSGFALDVADAQACREGVKTAWDAFGRIDLVVNVAGVAHPTPFLEVPPEDWDAEALPGSGGDGCAAAGRFALLDSSNPAAAAGRLPALALRGLGVGVAPVVLAAELFGSGVGVAPMPTGAAGAAAATGGGMPRSASISAPVAAVTFSAYLHTLKVMSDAPIMWDGSTAT